MQLQEVHGKSKKTGKEYVAFTVKIGEYNTPLFFPTKIEQMYINTWLKKQAHADFKAGDENDEPLDVGDEEDDD